MGPSIHFSNKKSEFNVSSRLLPGARSHWTRSQGQGPCARQYDIKNSHGDVSITSSQFIIKIYMFHGQYCNISLRLGVQSCVLIMEFLKLSGFDDLKDLSLKFKRLNQSLFRVFVLVKSKILFVQLYKAVYERYINAKFYFNLFKFCSN